MSLLGGCLLDIMSLLLQPRSAYYSDVQRENLAESQLNWANGSTAYNCSADPFILHGLECCMQTFERFRLLSSKRFEYTGNSSRCPMKGQRNFLALAFSSLSKQLISCC